MDDKGPALGLFEGYGLELEYMITGLDSLAVRPAADQVLASLAGRCACEVELGALACSNELALHLLELKTPHPVRTLDGLAERFQEGVERLNKILAGMQARLMPTAMHPWMDPVSEFKIWPHEYHPVYAAFHRIFGCADHGWANLQSAHLNLPFRGDEEFARLHAAVRLVLPLLPALAASSPFQGGAPCGLLDGRMEAYRHHTRSIPALTGRVIPEPLYSREAYERGILAPIYAALAPQDPQGLLQEEWANARGAIARFERGSLEIRVLDVQESPRCDLAIVALAAAAIRALVEERWSGLAAQQAWPVERLEAILLDTIRAGNRALLSDPEFLRLFGLERLEALPAGILWRHLYGAAEDLLPCAAEAVQEVLEVIFEQGCLARRILRAVGESPTPARLREVYGRLCECLAAGEIFSAQGAG